MRWALVSGSERRVRPWHRFCARASTLMHKRPARWSGRTHAQPRQHGRQPGRIVPLMQHHTLTLTLTTYPIHAQPRQHGRQLGRVVRVAAH